MMRIFPLILLLSTHCLAANWSKYKDDQLKMELSVLVPASTLEIKGDQTLGGRVAQFKSSVANKTGVGFSYRNIGFTAGLSNPQKPDDKTKYGESSSQDYQFRFFGKRTYEFTYQEYQGLYLVDSYKLDPAYTSGGNELHRDDIKVKNYGMNFFWNFHDEDFSMDAVFAQNNRHKESGWGAQGIITVSQQVLSGRSAFIPTTATASFGKIGSLKEISRLNIAAGGAIGGLLTTHNWYLGALLGLGFGYQDYQTQFESFANDSSSQTGVFASIRMSLGYNGEKHVFGLQAINDGYSSALAGGNISNTATDSKLFYAYRFDDVNIPPFNVISAWFD